MFSIKQFINDIKESKTIAIICHKDPDTDALASSMAIKRLIKNNMNQEREIDLYVDAEYICKNKDHVDDDWCDREMLESIDNIFVMKKDDFNKYCEFIFNVIGEYLKRMDFSDMESITNYVEKNRKTYLKTTTPNNEVWYQARIGGFLAERLFTIFIKKNFNNPKHYSIDLTLKKYNKNT